MKKLIIVLIIFFLGSIITYAADPVSMKKRIGVVSGYTYSEAIISGETGANIKIPPMGPNGTHITCTLIAGANTGKFQFTTSSDTKVQADTANWIDWTEGDTTGSISIAVISQVTGIRGVSVSGNIIIEVVY